MRLNQSWENTISHMQSNFNSEEKQEAMYKQVAAPRLNDFRKPHKPEAEPQDEYLEKFYKLLAMALAADRHPDANTRLLKSGCTPSPCLKPSLNERIRTYRPNAMRAAFYNAIEINDDDPPHKSSSIPALLADHSTYFNNPA